jgi:chromosome segregation ATPase
MSRDHWYTDSRGRKRRIPVRLSKSELNEYICDLTERYFDEAEAYAVRKMETPRERQVQEKIHRIDRKISELTSKYPYYYMSPSSISKRERAAKRAIATLRKSRAALNKQLPTTSQIRRRYETAFNEYMLKKVPGSLRPQLAKRNFYRTYNRYAPQ